MNTPVLLLIFNRPGQVARQLDCLRAVRPAKLYVAADGPRRERPGEEERCAAARAELDKVDWPCELITLFRKRNLGCGLGVSGAISWFFEQQSEGIILEDDIAVTPSFFSFCSAMLEKYRDDPRVMQVSGNNFTFPAPQGTMPWFFSSFASIWGWATWARAWKHFSFTTDNLQAFVRDTLPLRVASPETRLYWSRALKTASDGSNSIWSYQWCKALLEKGGLSVVPGNNLAGNVGLGADATHTDQGRAMNLQLRPAGYTELGEGPEGPEADAAYDAYMSRYFLVRRTPGPDDWLEEAQARFAKGQYASCLCLIDAVEATFKPWHAGEPGHEYDLLREYALRALDCPQAS